jgi:hypothetical protein
VSDGENWKSEEREEDEEAAALRRSCGSGEADRRDGRAALREFVVEVIFLQRGSYRTGRGGDMRVVVVFGGVEVSKHVRKNWPVVIGPATDHGVSRSQASSLEHFQR